MQLGISIKKSVFSSVFNVVYSKKAAKYFKRIPKAYQIKLKNKIEELALNPQIPGTIKLVDYPIAKYRHRAGNYRILFDIDTLEKTLEIVDIRRRDEQTYR